MTTARHRLLGVLAAVGLGACSASGGEAECTAAARDGYPEGPFGMQEGDTIDDLGFVDAAGAAVTLGDLHRDADNRLILLSTAAFWCVACIEEQPTLQAWHEEHHDAGLAIVVSVFEDVNAQPAEADEAQRWIDQYGVEFLVVADTPFVLEPFYPNADTSVTPLNLVIDACSMEIISSSVGADSGALAAIIEARL